MQFLFSLSSFSSSAIVLFSLIAFVLFCNTNAVIRLPQNISVPAVIAFGDSIVDTGNNNHLKSVVKCNFAPYGNDFRGKVPTGRFGNGKVPADLIGIYLSLFLSLFAFAVVFFTLGFVCFLSLSCYLT